MPYKTDAERFGHSCLTSVVGLGGFCAAVGGLMLITSDFNTLKGMAKLAGGLVLWSVTAVIIVRWLRS